MFLSPLLSVKPEVPAAERLADLPVPICEDSFEELGTGNPVENLSRAKWGSPVAEGGRYPPGLVESPA